MKTLLSFLFILTTFYGCATREEIERRELLLQVSQELEQQQKLSAETVVRMGDIEERIGLVSGKIEEGQHKERMSYISQMEKLQVEIGQMGQQMKSMEERFQKMESEQSAQKKYLEDVLSALNKVTNEKPSGKKASEKINSAYDDAMSMFEKGQFKNAKSAHEELVNDQKIKGNKKARVLHNLGIMAYQEKKYDEALAYFSKLYTDHSGSSYSPNGLLHLGKSFEAQNKLEEAKQTWQELLAKYPKSKHANTAKKLLKE